MVLFYQLIKPKKSFNVYSKPLFLTHLMKSNLNFYSYFYIRSLLEAAFKYQSI